MKIEVKIEFKDYLRISYLLTYRKPLIILLTTLGAIMLVISVLYFLGFNMPFEKPPIVPFIGGVFMIIVLPISIYWSAKRSFLSNRRLQEKLIYEFTKENIVIKGETFNSELNWSKTYKIKELKNWILIYQSRLTANVIPKKSFDDQFSSFKEIILSTNIKAKFKD